MAAAQLYVSGVCENFLFSTGVSAKQIAKFGADVPAEAFVYRDAFLEEIARLELADSAARSPAKTFIEDKSVNTVGNLQGNVQMCIDNNWQKVGILSSDYHVPRIRALLTLLMKQTGLAIEFDYLLSESILKAAHPGVYDVEFDAAYDGPEGKGRLANEKQGLQDLEEGRYVFSEFQLVSRQ